MYVSFDFISLVSFNAPLLFVIYVNFEYYLD